MVTADVFKTQSYEMPPLWFGFLVPPEKTVLLADLVWRTA